MNDKLKKKIMNIIKEYVKVKQEFVLDRDAIFVGVPTGTVLVIFNLDSFNVKTSSIYDITLLKSRLDEVYVSAYGL